MAAPTRNPAVIQAIQTPIFELASAPINSRSAGRATSGNSPISKPSNIQPRKAAARAM